VIILSETLLIIKSSLLDKVNVSVLNEPHKKKTGSRTAAKEDKSRAIRLAKK
jgi:hypothetical protein